MLFDAYSRHFARGPIVIDKANEQQDCHDTDMSKGCEEMYPRKVWPWCDLPSVLK